MSHTGPLILASTSVARRRLLERLRIPFLTDAPEIAETPQQGETAAALAGRLAIAKAHAVAARHQAGLVIGGDQTADCAGTLLNKPLSRTAARAQLRSASGRRVVFHSGICIVDAASGQCMHETVPVTVEFRKLDPQAIARYVDCEPALHAAGSFHIEGLGVSLFERVSSDDPSSLVGLPLITLCRLLRSFDYEVLDHASLATPPDSR
ncbi:MAG: septum formation protein Maf [Gammaproteobacteria bacterium]|nr:septum formation protein Maf [Gammaproteobacteria bacterium]